MCFRTLPKERQWHVLACRRRRTARKLPCEIEHLDASCVKVQRRRALMCAHVCAVGLDVVHCDRVEASVQGQVSVEHTSTGSIHHRSSVDKPQGSVNEQDSAVVCCQPKHMDSGHGRVEVASELHTRKSHHAPRDGCVCIHQSQKVAVIRELSVVPRDRKERQLVEERVVGVRRWQRRKDACIAIGLPVARHQSGKRCGHRTY